MVTGFALYLVGLSTSKSLTSLTFLTLGIAQTSLALLSLNRKVQNLFQNPSKFISGHLWPKILYQILLDFKRGAPIDM